MREKFGRQAARFRAADEVVLVLGNTRIPLVDVSETGVQVVIPEGLHFAPEQMVEFKLIIRDELGVDAWHVPATCAWSRKKRAGFRMASTTSFSREIYVRLLRLVTRGAVEVISGVEN